ncbi:MAG: hypothetical protein Q8Q01_03150 [archaeon]|nr:hypothetical protein [archaeon]
MKFKRIGKKGIVSINLLELFSMVAFTVIIYFLVSLLLFSGIDSAHKESKDNVAAFKRVDAGVQNLRVLLQEGANLQLINIETTAERSGVLAGKTITSCTDYIVERDCIDDTTAISDGTFLCKWAGELCYAQYQGFR